MLSPPASPEELQASHLRKIGLDWLAKHPIAPVRLPEPKGCFCRLICGEDPSVSISKIQVLNFRRAQKVALELSIFDDQPFNQRHAWFVLYNYFLNNGLSFQTYPDLTNYSEQIKVEIAVYFKLAWSYEADQLEQNRGINEAIANKINAYANYNTEDIFKLKPL